MGVVQVAVLAIATSAYASFVWAIARYFRRPTAGLPARMKHLQLAGSVCMVLQGLGLAWPGAVRGGWGLVGGTMLGLSLLLFWWTVGSTRHAPPLIAFSSGSPGALLLTGPFRFVRHPFYASYLLAWIGGAVAARQPWLLGTVIVMGVLYDQAARQEESALLAGEHGPEYREYMKRSGRFAPWIG